MPDKDNPGLNMAKAISVLVEVAKNSDGRTSIQAFNGLNKQFKLFRGHRGEFTPEQQVRLFEAAKVYIADPANQVDMTESILKRFGRGKAAAPKGK